VDPLFTSEDAWCALLSRLQSRQLVVNLRCLNEQRVFAGDTFSTVKKARWHRLSLDESQEALWRQMAPETRRAIRRAERAGVAVRPVSGGEDVQMFHRLHASLRKRKYRLLAQPLRFFEAIEQRFRDLDSWHSLGAFLDNRMIAATIYLRWGDTLYYKFNASAPEDLSARPNNLLVWSGIALAQSLGCRFLDLGPSDDDQPGLIRFKRNFGAQEQELRFLRWTPPDWREPSSIRGILGEMTRLFTAPEVPDEITIQAGNAFYRYFA